MKRLGLLFAIVMLAGCGGGSSTLQFVGAYMGSMNFSVGPYATTGSLTFDPPLKTFTGSWNDHGTTRAITGTSVNSTTVSLGVENSGGTDTYTGTLTLGLDNHVSGTLTGASSSTLTVDLAPSG